MSGPQADILTAIRAAAAHETAAAKHEDRYEQQMRSAGASMYAAFTLALRSAEDYKGRKIDDKAVLRIYKSTAPRKWWDEHLAAAKFVDGKGRADRDHAARLLQWHVDVDGARARRAQHSLSVVASRKRVGAAKVKAARGSTLTREPEAALSAAREAEHWAARDEAAAPNAAEIRVEDLLGEVNRISSAARKVDATHRAEALEALRVTAREIERYVA